MTTQSLRRPIGFSPSEISARVNEEVISQHAEEAAFLWTMRSRAVGEPHYSLEDLTRLDERVEAHVHGLRIAGDIGWKYCKANLENLEPGEVFALSVVAFGAGDRERMTEALNAGCTSAKTTVGLVSALGWIHLDAVAPWIGRLLVAKSPIHRAVGVRASAIHRHDPGSMLSAAISDPEASLRVSALRTVGELKRRDVCNQVRTQLRADDEASRFWAAWALALHGERDGRSMLTQWLERPDGFGMRARQLALRAMHLDESREWISALAQKPELAAQAVTGAGVVGDPAAIPWLIRKMESPELARLAGEAFSMITGVDLAYEDLDQDPPTPGAAEEEPIEDIPDLDYESNLPWPSPKLVAQWWEKNGHNFSPGIRHLAGQPIRVQTALDVLRKAKQRQRAAAALELALHRPDQTLFEVRARGHWQQRELTRWTS